MKVSEHNTTRPNTPADTPGRLNDEAWELTLAQKDTKRAILLATEAEALARAAGDTRELSRALSILGNQLAFQKGEQAEVYLREALDLSKNESASLAYAWALYGLTKRAFRAGDLKEALSKAMQMRDYCVLHKLERGQANADNALGNLYLSFGIYQEALKHFHSALDLYKVTGDEENAIVPLYNLNLIFTELGDYERALTYAVATHEAFENHDDRMNAAGAMMRIGELQNHLKRFDQALKSLKQSCQTFAELQDSFHLAQATFHLGEVYKALGQLERSEKTISKSLQTFTEGKHSTQQVRSLRSLASIYFEQARFNEALVLLKKAADIAGERALKKEHYEVHEALSETYAELGNMTKALEHHRDFHQLREEVWEEKLKSVLEGLQLQFDVDREHQTIDPSVLTNAELARLNRKLRTLKDELERQSVSDELTKLYNRRYLNAELEKAFKLAKKENLVLSVVLCDIDHFKQINDNFSHAMGDRVLREVAMLFKQNVKATDIVARYGGEEFAIVLPGTALEHSVNVAERIRAAIEAYPWHKIDPKLRVTLSLGVSADLSVDDHEKLLNLADKKLYQAKHAGRNRVRF